MIQNYGFARRVVSSLLYPHPVVIMLKAYFDESGKIDQPMSCVAGSIATLEAWENLEQAWSKVLKEYGVSWHHQVDYAHSKGQYIGWENNEDKRRNYLSNLLKIMDHFVSLNVGAVIPMNVYHQLSQKQKEVVGDPYLPCVQVCLHLSALEAKGLAKEVLADIVIAENKEMVGKAEDLYYLARKYLPEDLRFRLPTSVTIARPHDKEEFRDDRPKEIPLQVADIVAYELNAHARGKTRYPMQQIMKDEERYYFHHFNPENLNSFCQPWTP